MIDLKSWRRETHYWLVGRDNSKVIASIELLARYKKLHELRLLHVPNKSDLENEVVETAQLIRTLPNNVIIRLNAFQHHGVVGEALYWPKCTHDQLEAFRDMLSPLIPNSIKTSIVHD